MEAHEIFWRGLTASFIAGMGTVLGAETHRNGYEDIATFSLLGGFAVMMFLDAVFA